MMFNRRQVDYPRLKEIIQLLIKYKCDNLVGELDLKGSRWGKNYVNMMEMSLMGF